MTPSKVDRETATALHRIYERAINALSEAEPILQGLPEAERTKWLNPYFHVTHAISFKLQAPLRLQYHDLDSDRRTGPSDTLLDSNEQALVSTLTSSDIECIDEALLDACVAQWSKVARVIGSAQSKLGNQFKALPDGYYAQRAIKLALDGKIVSQGNLNYVRYSEVRLA